MQQAREAESQSQRGRERERERLRDTERQMDRQKRSRENQICRQASDGIACANLSDSAASDCHIPCKPWTLKSVSGWEFSHPLLFWLEGSLGAMFDY